MTSLTNTDLNQFNSQGIREICAYNRDYIYNFNSLKKKQMIKLLISKSNEGYKIVIPKFVFNNDKYVKLNNVSKNDIRDEKNQNMLNMVLIYDKLYLFNILGLREICAYNRDCIYNFNSLSRTEVISLLISKCNEGYKIVIPEFVLKNDKYFRLKIKGAVDYCFINILNRKTTIYFNDF